MADTGDLLTAWREASRAASVAERLTELAREASERADLDSTAAEEIAVLAERAAAAAESAAVTARAAAQRASEFADQFRERRLHGALDALQDARALESTARDGYHLAERKAHQRHRTAGEQRA